MYASSRSGVSHPTSDAIFVSTQFLAGASRSVALPGWGPFPISPCFVVLPMVERIAIVAYTYKCGGLGYVFS